MNALKTTVLTAVLLSAAIAYGAASSISTSSQSGGGVTVKATHRSPDEANQLRFEIALDSSTVNLDNYDLKSSVFIRSGGKTYEPTKVEAKGDGRHREMVVVFPRVSTPSVELIVRDIAGVKERAFRFTVQ